MDRPDELLVTFWGTRGSIPTPGRATEKYGGNTSCIEVRFNNDRIILDAGTGIRNLGLELVKELKSKQAPLDLTLLISHTHWDHIQGLPFFVPAYIPETKLRICGNPNKGKMLSEILGGQMDVNYFPVDMSMLGADLDIGELPSDNFSVGDISVEWQEQFYHPGGSLRFKLEAGGRKFVYASDVELESMFDVDPSTEVTEERKAAYLDFVSEADLLVADGQYTAEEYATKKGWGHTAIPRLLEIAHSASVKRLAVFHHEPLYSDRKLDELYVEFNGMYANATPAMDVFWAREGVTLSV